MLETPIRANAHVPEVAPGQGEDRRRRREAIERETNLEEHSKEGEGKWSQGEHPSFLSRMVSVMRQWALEHPGFCSSCLRSSNFLLRIIE